jgi:hypothetical protein
MHMSHKKRASTAFKSIGAAGLVAATIVTGLSFAPTTASAIGVEAETSYQAFEVGTNKYLTVDGPEGYRLFTSKSTPNGAGTFTPPALGQSSKTTFELKGYEGCVFATSYNGQWVMGYSSFNDKLARCQGTTTSNRWTLEADGTLSTLAAGSKRYVGRSTADWYDSYTKKTFGGVALTSNRNDAAVIVGIKRPLSVQLGEVNNIAKTAVVSGTATPKGTVTIGSKTVNVADDGSWSMTVEGLRAGEQTLTAKQRFNNADVDSKDVKVTIVEGGTVVGVDQGPIDLTPGESTQVPMVVQNNEFRAEWDGTVVLNAPEGTTFDGQTRIDADFGGANGSSWGPITSMPLTNGRLSNNDKTITFDAKWTSGHGAPEQYRYMVNVTADENAAAGSGQMGFTFAGDSSKGDFRAQGKTTTTTTTPSVAAPTGTVTFSDDVAQKATVSGTGVDGATITLYAGDSTTAIGTAVVRNGTWSTTIDPIGAGDQKIRIEQSGIDGIQTAETIAQYGAAVTLDEPASSTVTPGAVTVTGAGQADTTVTITGGAKPVTTTVKADGTFTAEVELAPSNSAKTLTAQQRSKGNLTTSDTITVTPNGAQTARPVVITEPTSHTYKPNRETTISGTATPYAKIDLRFQWNDTVYGEATADINGNWSITRGFGPAAKYELTATQTRFDTTTSTSAVFNLDPEGITNQEVVITGPADHAYKPGEQTRVTGTATPYAKIELRFQWNDTVYGTATANADGNWNILRAYGPSATYELTAKQLRADGTTSLSNTFTLEATGIDRPFTLTTPTMDSTFEAGVPVSFTGTGTRGATITAVAPAWNNNEIFKTEVDDNGKWEIRRGFAPGITYDLTLVQQPVDGEPTSIAGVHLTPAN